jgi:hypothetical protein
MIDNVNNNEANVISKVDLMRKEIEFSIEINNKCSELNVALLYEEHNNDESERILYGYQVGSSNIKKPSSNSSEIEVDFLSLICEDIADWMSWEYDDEKLLADKDLKDIHEKIQTIIIEENLL